MPRSTLRGGGEPLLALSDGLNERAMRAAAARASQQDGVDGDDPVEEVHVDGVVFHVHRRDPDSSAEDGDTVQEDSPAVVEEDPFAFPGEDGQVDEAVVNGHMAREEDEREYRFAEQVVNEAVAEEVVEEQVEEHVILEARAVREHFPPQVPVRHRGRRRVLRNTIQGIVSLHSRHFPWFTVHISLFLLLCAPQNKSAIRRLARKGGVKRVSCLIYEEVRGVLKTFLQNVLHHTIVYTSHAKRKVTDNTSQYDFCVL